jgi:hypothetical protein
MITCLREILEIVIASVQKGAKFNSELFNPEYTHLGISLSREGSSGASILKLIYGAERKYQ